MSIFRSSRSTHRYTQVLFSFCLCDFSHKIALLWQLFHFHLEVSFVISVELGQLVGDRIFAASAEPDTFARSCGDWFVLSRHFASTLWSSRNSRTCVLLCSAAKCNGVLPEKSFCERSAFANWYDFKRFKFPTAAAAHIFSPIAYALPCKCAPHCIRILMTWKIEVET